MMSRSGTGGLWLQVLPPLLASGFDPKLPEARHMLGMLAELPADHAVRDEEPVSIPGPLRKGALL